MIIKKFNPVLILFCLSLVGCETVDIIAGLGAGASVAGLVAPPLITGTRLVSPKAVLEKIDEAYKEYDVQVQNLMNNTGLSPKERKALIKEKTRVLNSRVKSYKSLLGNAYGFPQELIRDLSSPEGQEFIGELAKVLPPPFNEVALGGTSLGLLVLTILGYGGRGRFRNTAVLLGNMIEHFKKTGLLDKDKVKEVAGIEAGKSKMSMTDLHNFLKRHNIT
ncbi:MAG: hypothetical protein ACK4WF_05365 [Candidatus Brocadiales bacterium]